MCTTRAIFIWSGTMPRIIDKLTMCTSGEEMKFIDCFIIDIEMLSQPAALPDWNWFAIAIISSSVVKFKKIDWLKVTDKKCLYDIQDRIPLARFGPMLEKYWQNLFAITTASVISRSSALNDWLDFNFDFLLYRSSFSNLHVALTLVLDYITFLQFSRNGLVSVPVLFI